MRRGFAAAIYGVLTVALLWPLLLHFGSAFPHDPGDAILNTWILWHGTQTIPLTDAWWNGPMFYPMADAIALSEVLLSLLPMSAIVQALTHNPIAAYNTVFALSFPLCGLASYALCKELTGRQDAAIVGGLAFMLAPYRAEQLSHVPVLSYYWAPLIFLGLHRWLRERHWSWLVLFAGAWLAQSLANGYAMFHVSVLVAFWIVWFVRPIRAAVPIVLAGSAAAAAMLPILIKYEQVHAALHLLRDINEIKRFGVDLADFMRAAPDLAVWGGRLGLARPETAAFPGITLPALGVLSLIAARPAGARHEPQAPWQRAFILISAAAALVAFSAYLIGPWKLGPVSVRDFHKPFSVAVAARVAAFLGGAWTRRMWREQSVAGFYLLAMGVALVLALGPEPRLLGRPILYEPPYAWLMRLPGFAVLRVPARFIMAAAVCSSVLVALASARWATGSRRAVVIAAISAGLLLDGWFRLPVAAAPVDGIRAWPDSVAAVVELPLGNPQTDFFAIARAMNHGKPIVNGVSGYVPPHYLPLADALRDKQYAALYELTAGGPIGIALDRMSLDAPEIKRLLAATGLVPGSSSGNWDSFIVPVRPGSAVVLGVRVPIAGVRASAHGEDVGRMLDDRVTTAWGTGVGQVAGEEVIADLGNSRDIGAVVLEMGAYSFGFPRRLEIDASTDGLQWHPVWGGAVGVLAVRGAVQDPASAPIAIDLGRVNARYLRLRQTGADPTIPWWIADLHVHAPVQ
jgi:hypothetical protein